MDSIVNVSYPTLTTHRVMISYITMFKITIVIVIFNPNTKASSRKSDILEHPIFTNYSSLNFLISSTCFVFEASISSNIEQKQTRPPFTSSTIDYFVGSVKSQVLCPNASCKISKSLFANLAYIFDLPLNNSPIESQYSVVGRMSTSAYPSLSKGKKI